MKFKRKYLFFFMLALPLLSISQKVDNIRFEQIGKQIHIYYDLEGDQEYTVQVFCSNDNGQSWGRALQMVTGAVGENQKPGNGKIIVWDVINEKERLRGYIKFKIEIREIKNVAIKNRGLFPSTSPRIRDDNSKSKGIYTDYRDGQTYKWIKIGDQVWMAENLNYKTGNSWCYKNKIDNCNKFGRLYNWNAAKNACPTGWYLPSENEWKTLEMHLGMSPREADDTGLRGTDEGKKLKSATGWRNSGNGTNEVDFNALPGGYRSYSGNFSNLGNYGRWWSAPEYGSRTVWDRGLVYNRNKVRRTNYGQSAGFSVRCVRE